MVLKEFQHLACRVSNGEAQNIFFQKHASLISVERRSRAAVWGSSRRCRGISRHRLGSSCRRCWGAHRSPTELGCYGQGAVTPSTAGNDTGPALCAVEAVTRTTAGVAGSGRTRAGCQTSETGTWIVSARWWPGRGPSGWDPPV